MEKIDDNVSSINHSDQNGWKSPKSKQKSILLKSSKELLDLREENGIFYIYNKNEFLKFPIFYLLILFII